MYRMVWERRYLNYKSGAGKKPSLFSSEVIGYFPQQGKMLELGAGYGQDSRFFAERGYDVISTDFADSALRLSAAVTPQALRTRVTVVKLDMCSTLPFSDACFDVVYAHLSLHYFNRSTTLAIIGEVKRVLKESGVFAFLVNSTSDTGYGTGLRIEKDFFRIDEDIGTVFKRYFSVDTAKQFVTGFKTILLDDSGEDHHKSAEGIHNLIRFVGTTLPRT
jgi:SAM-dependent methyltransferase